MLEESVEAFVLQWRTYATPVRLFAHTEGSPLLECQAGSSIFHVFERTGPYLARPGQAQLIINPMSEQVTAASEAKKKLEVRGLSHLAGQGLVLEKTPETVALDVGFPLVLGVLGGVSEEIVAGDWLAFESLTPVHGFIVPPITRTASSASFEEI